MRSSLTRFISRLRPMPRSAPFGPGLQAIVDSGTQAEILSIWRQFPPRASTDTVFLMVEASHRLLREEGIAASPGEGGVTSSKLWLDQAQAASEAVGRLFEADEDRDPSPLIEDAVGTLTWASAALGDRGARQELVTRLAAVWDPEQLTPRWFDTLRQARHDASSWRRRQWSAGVVDVPAVPLWRAHPPSMEVDTEIVHRISRRLRDALSSVEWCVEDIPARMDEDPAWCMYVVSAMESRASPSLGERRMLEEAMACASWLAVRGIRHHPDLDFRHDVMQQWARFSDSSPTIRDGAKEQETVPAVVLPAPSRSTPSASVPVPAPRPVSRTAGRAWEPSVAERIPGSGGLPAVFVVHETPVRLPCDMAVLSSPLHPLPWPSSEAVSIRLRAEFPWAEELIETIRGELRLAEVSGGWGRARRIAPICLVGRAGVGKSRIAQRIVRIVEELGGPPSETLNLGGSTDNRTLAGTSRGWANACPSLPTSLMARTGCPNPVVVLEEIDKAGGSRDRSGSAHDTLLAMTDPSTAGCCLDEGLGVRIDMGLVSWIMTANDRGAIPPLLRARTRFVEIPPPRPEDFPLILEGCLRDVAQEIGSCVEALPEIVPEVRDEMERGFRSGALSARSVSRLVRGALVAGAVLTAPRVLH